MCGIGRVTCFNWQCAFLSFPNRIPLTKFPSVRRILNEAGSEIPDLNAMGEFLKYKLGVPGTGDPTPETLKNYMDVSTAADSAESLLYLAAWYCREFPVSMHRVYH